MRKWGLIVGVSAAAILAAGGAEAASKGKFYEACAASVTQARELIPPPPPDIAGTAKKAGDVANVASKIPGLGGLGGAFGGLGKVASTAQTVAKYSDIIGDVAQFTTKMKENYPDNAARMAAYGDRMAADADKVNQAGDRLDEAHDCYAKAHEELKAGVAAKEIKGKDASDRQKEIQGAVGDMGGIVADARTTMNTNIKSYNDALSGDTSGIGLNLGTLVSAASMAGVTPASVMGLPTVPGVPNTPEAQAQAYQLAAAAQANGYSAGNSQAQNYAALAKARTQVNTSALGLPDTPDGSSRVIEQAAAYRAQVVGQSGPTSIDPAGMGQVAQSYGALGNLSRLSALSKGPLGAVNLAGEAASMAKSGGAAAAPAAPEVAPDMMKSLEKVGDDSGKYMGAFQRIDAQAVKFTTLKASVGEKLD